MIVAPCITLGAALFIVATLLLVEDEINYPAAGSGARGRSAAKRSAEASGGASILKGASEADRSHTPVNRVRLSALHPFSTGSVLETTPAKRQVTGFVSKQIEKCRKALAARVTTSTTSQSSVNASGQCPPVETLSRRFTPARDLKRCPRLVASANGAISSGERFAHDMQTVLSGLVIDGILSEREYNHLARRIRCAG